MAALEEGQNILGPKGKWFSGHLHEFQQDPLQFMTTLARDYGGIARFQLGPFQKVHLVSDPVLIKEILVTKQAKFSKSHDLRVLKDVVGEGLLTSEKEFHMRQRRLIQPAFKQTHIMNYAEDMIDITYDYIRKWEHEEEYLITDDMMNITLGIISKTMFSMKFDEGTKRIGQPIESYMKLAIKRMRNLVSFPLWVPTKKNRVYKHAIKELDKVLYQIIDARRKSSDCYEDLLGMLMAARDEEAGIAMSDQQLRDELMTIFLAGHETTGNALSWTVHLLSQNPDVEEKLSEELHQVIGERDIRPEDFKRLTYTQNIISESLRLFPPAYVIGRQADSDVQIGPYLFKKGNMILLSPYVTHRDPTFYHKPDSFIPERFENNLIKSLPAYAYFPFGGGPRVCIGNHFAMMEAVLVLACLYQRYSFTPTRNHHEVKPQPLITLRPKHGLRMRLRKRD